MTRIGRIGLSFLLVASVVATVATIGSESPAQAEPLVSGRVTMVSTPKDGDAVPANFSTDAVSISDDGSAVAFTSTVPADLLVTDTLQTGVTDTNGESDVFVYWERVPGEGKIVTLVSINANGDAADAESRFPQMAPLGVGLVFESAATDLVAETVPPNGRHLYAWVPVPNQLHSVFLIDEVHSGGAATGAVAGDASISLFPIPRVVFTAGPGNVQLDNGVVPNTTDVRGATQVYARDVIGQSTTLVSVDGEGKGAAGGASSPMIAGFAPVVVFLAEGDGLQPNFDGTGINVWTRELTTGTTILASVEGGAAAGTTGTTGNTDPVISRLGTTVAWASNDAANSATPFAPQNTLQHVFAKVIGLPTQLIDVNVTGVVGCNSFSSEPALSGDGTVVAFSSNCSDIVDPNNVLAPLSDTNGTSDVFARRLIEPTPVLVSINDAGTGTGNGASDHCGPNVSGQFPFPCVASSFPRVNPNVTVSFDGSAVVFHTMARDIATVPVPPPPDGQGGFINGNVIVGFPRYLTSPSDAPRTFNASVSIDDDNPNGTSGSAVIAQDASAVAYVSYASDLVTGDDNGIGDAFLVDLRNEISVESPSPTPSEADGKATITVRREGNLTTTDTVDYETVAGVVDQDLPNELAGATAATAAVDANVVGGDYVTETGTITFDPGETSKEIEITLIDDAVAEGLEAFRIALDNASSGATITEAESYVGITDDDGGPDWSVAIAAGTPIPAFAEVGDEITFDVEITVDAGADPLDVGTITSGPGTTGFTIDPADIGAPSADPVPAGTTATVTVTATLTAAPGVNTNAIEIVVAGALGNDPSEDRSATTTTVGSQDAVVGLLTSDAGPTVQAGDQILYTLVFTNGSDSSATLTGLPAAFEPPTGTTLVSRVDPATTTLQPDDGAPGGSDTSTWTLLVTVDAAPDGTVISQQPGLIRYDMAAASLTNEGVALDPTKVDTTVGAASAADLDVTAHTIIDTNGATLVPGDPVEVQVTVTNNGDQSATSVVLTVTVDDIEALAGAEVDDVACGGFCDITGSTVTAQLGAFAPADDAVVSFTGTIPANPADGTASSSAVVTYVGGADGASPTTADVATATIALPDLPVGVDDAYQATEDTLLNVALTADGVLANDTDPEGNPLTATDLDASQTDGAVALDPDGTFIFTPDTDFAGETTFTYRPTDGTFTGDVTTVTITVSNVNDAPTGVADAYPANQDELLSIPAGLGVLDNDTDPDAGDTLTATSLVEGPDTHGDVTLQSDGSFTYQPTAGYTGPATFTYVPNDGSVAGEATTVTITVAADVPDAPVADADAYATDEDTDLSVPAGSGVLVGDTDADGDALAAVQLVEGPDTHGDVTLNPDGSFTYEPDANFNGVATFTYRASDGSLTSAATTVTITVAAVNDAPQGVADTASIESDGGAVVIEVLANDTDVDGDPLTVQVVTQPLHGTVVCTPSGTCTYTPDPGYVGPDSFEYVIDDGQVNGSSIDGDVSAAAASGPIKVDITVNPKQQASTTSTSTTSTTAAVGGGGVGGGGTGRPIPRTGSEAIPLAVLGAGLLLLGFGAVRAGQRRRV